MPEVSPIRALAVWEFLTGVEALNYWAQPVVLRRLKTKRIQAKNEHLRAAVIAGIGPGEAELVPRELVHDEVAVMKSVAEWLTANRSGRDLLATRSWMREASVPVESEADAAASFSRPMPVPAAKLHEVVGALVEGISVNTLSKLLAARRLGCAERTIRYSLGRKRRTPSTPTQKVLASMFLDFASQEFQSKLVPRMAPILDALVLSDYPGICLFYLVHQIHRLTVPVALGLTDAAVVEMLCARATPAFENGPFRSVTRSGA